MDQEKKGSSISVTGNLVRRSLRQGEDPQEHSPKHEAHKMETATGESGEVANEQDDQTRTKTKSDETVNVRKEDSRKGQTAPSLPWKTPYSGVAEQLRQMGIPTVPATGNTQNQSSGNIESNQSSGDGDSNLTCTKHGNSSKWFYFIISFLILMVAVVYVKPEYVEKFYNLIAPKQPAEQNPRKEIWNTFRNSIEDKKKSYSLQNSQIIWGIIEAQMFAMLNSTQPTKPAILLFVSTPSSSEFAFSIAENVAASASKAYGDQSYTILDGSKYLSNEPDITKHEIDDAFSDNFKKNSQHVVLLKNFDQFPPKSIEIFISLADHENAPYKDGVLIMTVSSNHPLQNIDRDRVYAEFDELAEKRLKEAWKNHLPSDTILALISRIVVSAIVIQ